MTDRANRRLRVAAKIEAKSALCERGIGLARKMLSVEKGSFWWGRLAASRSLKAILGALVVAGLARGAVISMEALIAKLDGPVGLGAFSYSMGVGLLLGTASPLGLQVAATRFIPEYIVKEQWGQIRGLLSRAFYITLILSGFAALVLALVATIATSWFGSMRQHELLWAAALTMPFAIRRLARRELMGMRLNVAAIAGEDLLAPLLVTGVVGVLIFTHSTDARMIYTASYAVASLVGAAMMFHLVRKSLPAEVKGAETKSDTRLWISVGAPMMMAALAQTMIERIDVLLLAPLLGVQSVGYYTAAYRIAAILNFFPIIIGQVVAANIAIAYYRSDIGSLRRVFHQALFATGMLALPLTIALFVFARPLVHLIYGVAFDPAVSLLRLLLVGQAINCATGPVGAVLTMAGRERTFAIINICSAMFAVVFCYLGIRWMGLNGAGLAASSTLALLNLAQFVAVRSIISTKVAESKHKL